MSTLLLLRHGLTKMTGPVLAGRTRGVHLDERAEEQAAAVAERIGVLPLSAIVSSPLDRCVETATFVQAVQHGTQQTARDIEVQLEDRIIECGYGDWTGKPIKDVAKDPMWKVVQSQPSAARFPNGEALSEVSARAVQAV